MYSRDCSHSSVAEVFCLSSAVLMINYQTIRAGSQQMLEGSSVFPYQQPHLIFQRLYRAHAHKFLLESKDISPVYGRMSLIGIDPVLKITGKDEKFCIESLNERASLYAKHLGEHQPPLCERLERSEHRMEGGIRRQSGAVEETERSKQQNIVQLIRTIIQTFSVEEKTFLGLYGAFSYDVIRQFEDIGSTLPENDINDFTFFLYDTFLLFDHLKQRNEIIVYRRTTQECERNISSIQSYIIGEQPADAQSYQIREPLFALDQQAYEGLVGAAKQYAEQGELFEVVFSNTLTARFDGNPFALYLAYRNANPSPYLFYMDFGTEQLVGASPEMMVRCERGVVSLRPISGTAKRGEDPVEDHENMLLLLSDPKERAELDMLIDLGRNDLSRVCEPGVAITDYRFVEKYSRVMHTVAHLTGKLRADYTALDALIACLNAGTLTGAPKVAAMRMIERHEKERRGYYGGTIGYLTFSGDMDTGIIIRTAHIKGNVLRFQVGATLLYDSVPEKEYQETLNKADAFLKTFSSSR